MPLLSPNFSLQELCVTSHRGPDGRLLDNRPGDLETLYLRVLAETLLEPIRVLWGGPVEVTSGYRSTGVEMAVSGKCYGQHMKGQAADLLPPAGLSVEEAYRRVYESALPYDQLLLETNGTVRWIHVSVAPVFLQPRREALTSPDNGRSWAVYQPPAPGGATGGTTA